MLDKAKIEAHLENLDRLLTRATCQGIRDQTNVGEEVLNYAKTINELARAHRQITIGDSIKELLGELLPEIKEIIAAVKP